MLDGTASYLLVLAAPSLADPVPALPYGPPFDRPAVFCPARAMASFVQGLTLTDCVISFPLSAQ